VAKRSRTDDKERLELAGILGPAVTISDVAGSEGYVAL
jgi:hypothetical protein